MPAPHRAGQHYVVRLTAPDGYQASRSYSVASPPDDTQRDRADGRATRGRRDLVVPPRRRGRRRRARGARADRRLVRLGRRRARAARRRRLGPRAADGDAAASRATTVTRTSSASSSRSGRPTTSTTPSELAGPETHVVYTRATPPGSPRPAGRLTAEDLAPLVAPDATAFVCGSPPFCDGVTELLSDLDFPTERIKVERFGETG